MNVKIVVAPAGLFLPHLYAPCTTPDGATYSNAICVI